MLAEVAARLGRYADAEALLERCLELAPGFLPARANYAIVLHRQGKSARGARKRSNRLLAARTAQSGLPQSQGGDPRAHRRVRRSRSRSTPGVLAEYPKHAKVWMSYGHALKTAGRQDRAIEAYRKSIELRPQLGEA